MKATRVVGLWASTVALPKFSLTRKLRRRVLFRAATRDRTSASRQRHVVCNVRPAAALGCSSVRLVQKCVSFSCRRTWNTNQNTRVFMGGSKRVVRRFISRTSMNAICEYKIKPKSKCAFIDILPWLSAFSESEEESCRFIFFPLTFFRRLTFLAVAPES